MNVCPRCHNDIELKGRSRRVDAYLCGICLDEEALIDWYKAKQRAGEIPGEVMKRETDFLNKQVSARSKTEK